ncbi:hypothetical protein B0A48_10726 [Cryoendolithus antarcticus]|uniref:Uncharacterized protein n=1 Tax=Cryoendolithus antarcticus TaxID=1507870 RepID=A0A1V8SY87_9PEZI|nr:hypothetical protein B0A48_10726 [Cryoendolithus antarcticus]
MAPPTQGRVQFIPPPPLPEFYVPASTNSEESKNITSPSNNDSLPPAKLDLNAASSADSKSQSLPESFTRLAVASTDAQQRFFATAEGALPPALITATMPVLATHPYAHHFASVVHPHTYTYHPTIPQPTRITAYPSLPGGVQPLFQPTNQPQPLHSLSVYHACRICHRPRSEKFHIQNPVIPGSKPSAPDICRRCRVKNVVEVEQVVQSQNEPIKLGVACLVPNEDYVTKERAKEEIALAKESSRARRDPSQKPAEEQKTSRSRERIVFRYVSVRDTSAPPPAPSPLRAEVSVENLAAMNLMNDQTPSERDKRRTSTKRYVVRTATDTAGEPARSVSKVYSVRSSQKDHMDSKDSSTSKEDARPGNGPDKSATPASKTSSSSRTAVPSVKQIRQAEDQGLDTAYLHTDTDIRKIARDEIERYRQAERLMAAHPEPYVHGHMVPVERTVPVERRIEKVRDSSGSKPWEEKVHYQVKVDGREMGATSIPPMPQPEPLPAFDRSSKSPSRPQKERDPSEDSRLWYHEPRDITKDAPPNAQPASGRTEVTERGRRTLTAFERDALKQEATDREQRSGRASYRSSTRPTDPPVSARVRELKEASDREVRVKRSETEKVTGYVTELRSTHSSHADSQRSARRSAADSATSQRQQDPGSQTGHEPAEQTTGALNMPSPRQYLRGSRSQVPATSDGTWYADRIKGVNITRSQDHKQQPADDDKTVWPAEEPTRPAASERTSTVKGDWDWEYTEHTVQPASRPASSRPFEDAEPRYMTETKSLLRRQSRPATSNHSPAGTARESSVRQAPDANFTPAPKRQDPTRQFPQLHSERERGSYVRVSEESTHVRFASKVEFSPTPPGSDEYLPDYLKKSQHRRQERRGEKVAGSGLRQQLNGPDERESAEELFVEYERRRASREQTPEPEDQRGKAESARLEMAYDAPSRSGEEQYVPSLRGGSNAGSRSGPLNDELANAARRHHDSRPGSAVASSRAGSQRSRHTGSLSRALSESPSREALRADFKADVRWDHDKFHAELRRHEAERPASSIGKAWEDDGKGPYREEQPVTESMDAFHGSGHGGSGTGRW